jgi:hypothetical protein
MGIKAGEDTFYQAQRGIVQDGLVLNLDAGVDESYSGGTVWRDLKGGNNGTLTNGPTFSSDNGGSLVFDGSNDYIARSNFIGTTSTFSVCHWIKLAVNQKTRTIFSNYTSSNRGWVTGISDYAQNVVKFYLGNTVHLYASSALDVNVWYLVSVTYDNGNPKIYINDTLNNSSSATVVFGSTLYSNDIGRLGVGSQYFNGSIANVSVYNRALTGDEIARNYNATRHRFGV